MRAHRLLPGLLALSAAMPAVAAIPSPSTSASPSPARVVVVIGHNGGAPDPRPPLRFADDDAARLFLQLAPGASRAFLLTTFDKESARLYPDLLDVARAPTTTGLAGVLGEAFWQLRQEKARGKETELVFAFAGHGDVDDSGRGFVVMADGPFFRDDLQTQVVAGSPADLNHIVVDACASYYFVKSRGDGATDGVPLSPKLLDVLATDGGATPTAADQARTGVLVSTSSAAETHESAALSAGVFSYLLRSALLGAGDVDGNGRIEYGEAAAFLASASRGLDDPRARLQVHAEAPLQRPHAALMNLATSGTDRFLAIEAGHPTRLRLKDARGQPFAEVHSDGRRPVYIALSGQPFFLVERGDEEAVLVPRSAGAFALSALSFARAPVGTRGDDSRGAFAPLFAEPFSRAFVDGFLSQTGLPPPSSSSSSSSGAVFQPAWAEAGVPPTSLPVGVVGGVAVGAAGVVGLGAMGALVMNQVAFAELERGFVQTGQLDPARTLEVEGWRNAATGLTLGAVGLGLVGGGLLLWSFSLEDGALVLP